MPGNAYAEEYQQRDEDKRTGRRRPYKWDFDAHMSIFEADPDGGHLKRLTDAPGYNAEGSFSPMANRSFSAPTGTATSSCTSWTPTGKTCDS